MPKKRVSFPDKLALSKFDMTTVEGREKMMNAWQRMPRAARHDLLVKQEHALQVTGEVVSALTRMAIILERIRIAAVGYSDTLLREVLDRFDDDLILAVKDVTWACDQTEGMRQSEAFYDGVSDSAFSVESFIALAGEYHSAISFVYEPRGTTASLRQLVNRSPDFAQIAGMRVSPGPVPGSPNVQRRIAVDSNQIWTSNRTLDGFTWRDVARIQKEQYEANDDQEGLRWFQQLKGKQTWNTVYRNWARRYSPKTVRHGHN